MISFANSKINLGLQVLRRRPDGYHDISTVMLPLPWCDIVEATINTETNCDRLFTSGNAIDCPPEKNLAMKALRALRQYPGIAGFPAVDIHLHKIVPDGAGLGGGSSDATHVIRAVNKLFTLELSSETIADIAAQVGSDCPFFAYDRPMWATGTGSSLTPIDIPQLAGMKLVVAKQNGISISTGNAYANIRPNADVPSLDAILARPITEWQGLLKNDFEESVFAQRPAISRLKDMFLSHGAVYSAMSGSGASVFAIFTADTDIDPVCTVLHDYQHFSCTLS